MWGRRGDLEQRLTAAQNDLTKIVTEFSGHIKDCSRRGDETNRKLDKLEGQLDKSSRERDDAIKALDAKFETKHKENRKYLFTILVTVIGALAVRLLDFVHIGATNL